MPPPENSAGASTAPYRALAIAAIRSGSVSPRSTDSAEACFDLTRGGVGLRPGFHLLNEEEQRDLLDTHFQEVFGPDLPRLERGRWRRPGAVVRNAIKKLSQKADELMGRGIRHGLG